MRSTDCHVPLVIAGWRNKKSVVELEVVCRASISMLTLAPAVVAGSLCHTLNAVSEDAAMSLNDWATANAFCTEPLSIFRLPVPSGGEAGPFICVIAAATRGPTAERDIAGDQWRRQRAVADDRGGTHR